MVDDITLKIVMSSSSASMEPVDKVAPINSPTDILKYKWSFTGSNSSSWIVLLNLRRHIFVSRCLVPGVDP